MARSTSEVGAQARHAAARAGAEGRDWLEKLGRLGFAAKGTVYLVVGVMALRAAIGTGRTTGSQGALEQIARAPLGDALLWIVALGLVGYAAWRFVQAVRDTEHVGTDAKGIAKRIGQAVSGVIHLGLAAAAVRIARLGAANGAGGVAGDAGGSGAGGEAGAAAGAAAGPGSGASASGGGAEEGLVAELLSKPFGTWLVMLVGAVIVGVAVQQFRRAWTASFRRELRTEAMDADERRWAERAGRAGYAARGITFTLIGAFVIVAGATADPERTQGLGEALQTLERQPFGPWLLAFVGLGLCAYAVFQFVLVRYRRMVLR